MKRIAFVMAFVASIMVVGTVAAKEPPFSELVGPIAVGPVQNQGGAYQVPFIVWGGDVVTMLANGGLTTRPGTIFAERNLNFKLVPGDNFIQQVRDYMSGKTPFLRGTVHMIANASELIASDPRTKGVEIFQLTWSAGDHMVVRGDMVRTIADLRGKTIVAQRCGPHSGLIDDVLKTGQLTWNDVTIIWADDLTGTDKSPAAIFRSNPNVAACCVITPDMLGLTGGLQQIGTGAESTEKGAKVLVSTAELSRSICDVYVVRKDFYDANTDQVKKFVAGYLKATEKLLAIKREYETKGNDEYVALLRMAQQIYGEAVLPTIEEDAHGLVCDSRFVGYPGNVVFFTEVNNLTGFDALQKKALDLAVTLGYVKVRAALLKPSWDWNDPILTGSLATTAVEHKERFNAEAMSKEIEELNSGQLGEKQSYSFPIYFDSNQEEFSSDQYAVEFQRFVEEAAKYANAGFAVRGHADPTRMLYEFVLAAQAKGVLQKRGAGADARYFYNNAPLDINNTAELIRLIDSGNFDGVTVTKPDGTQEVMNPRQTMQVTLNLSRRRAEAVKASVIAYAGEHGLRIDPSQITPVGVGLREPVIPRPRNEAEAAKNRRVEIGIVRVNAEAIKTSDFDY